MPATPLHDKLLAAGARLGEYLGAETAAAFSDPRQEYVELRCGCAVYDLGWRAKILATGKDRIRWANGMVSNNIRDLPAGRGNYNFVLTPQGRIVADLYVYHRGDYLLLDTSRAQAPRLLEILKKYIIMDQVELTDVSEKLTALALQGPRAREVLHDAGLQFSEVDPLQVQDIAWNDVGVSVTRMASDLAETYEIWLSPEHAGAVWDALLGRGARPAGSQALEMFRYAAGVPRYGLDVSDKNLPQETAQEQALDFQKGCYIGQEIVERIHSRAMLHRKLSGLLVEGPPPAPGTKIQADGKDVGEITSAATVPAADGDRTLAFGYLRMEALAPDKQVQVGGAPARVRLLPYKELAA